MSEDMPSRVTRLEAQIEGHTADCYRIRDAILKKFDSMGADFKDLRNDQKKQTWYLTLIIGGLIAASRLPDFISLIKH